MGLIDEGLTEGASPEQNFDAMLEEQERAAGVERAKRDDPASHDFNRVVQGLAAEVHGSRDIRAGLTFQGEADGEPDYSDPDVQERILRDSEKRLTDSGYYNRKQSREQEVRDALAERDFSHAVRDAETEDEVLSALHQLRGKAPEAYEAELCEMTKRYAGDPGEMGEDELDEFSSALDTLDNAVRRFGAAADYNRDLARYNELQHKYTAQRAELQREKVLDYFKRAGVSQQEALPRLEGAARLAAETGIDLNSIEPDDPRFAEVLSVFDASNVEARRAEATHAFQQSVLNAETKDIGSGLEYVGPFGAVPAQPRQLPQTELDPSRINARADRRVKRGVDIRRAIAAPDERDWKRGLTANGKPVSLDDASGATERAKQQQADELARSKGLLW
jgi:hypothetical protein